MENHPLFNSLLVAFMAGAAPKFLASPKNNFWPSCRCGVTAHLAVWLQIGEPSSSAPLRRRWTKNKQKHKLNHVSGLTHGLDQKGEPGQRLCAQMEARLDCRRHGGWLRPLGAVWGGSRRKDAGRTGQPDGRAPCAAKVFRGDLGRQGCFSIDRSDALREPRRPADEPRLEQ